MAELIVRHKKVETVFELLGDSENDITKSIAWGFINCPLLLKRIISLLLKIEINPADVIIKYQEYEKDKGITDLELTDNNLFYIIIEAKRGWILPQEEQLKLYSQRKEFHESPMKYRAIVSMSECSFEYANNNLPKIQGENILYLPWKTICEVAEDVRSEVSNKEKYIIDDLVRYIRMIMTTQNKDTNWVYVVSLGMSKAVVTTKDNKTLESDITYTNIVKQHKVYCCPVGGGKGGWPKEPLTYIAFRYEGKLQSIHHIEKYHITNNLHSYVPEIPDVELSETHFVYELGPAIVPQKEVRTGKKIVMSNRVWAQLDTLLTSDTITEAMEISKKRNS